MGRTVENLKGWFRSLRDTHTRLDKKKSGDGAVNLTEREQWIVTKFAFMKGVASHRPEPLKNANLVIIEMSLKSTNLVIIEMSDFTINNFLLLVNLF